MMKAYYWLFAVITIAVMVLLGHHHISRPLPRTTILLSNVQPTWVDKCAKNIETAYRSTTDVVKNPDLVKSIATKQCDCYWSQMREVLGWSEEEINTINLYDPPKDYKSAQNTCYELNKNNYF